MGLKAEIWALRLGEGGTKEEKKEEKIPHIYESIGHLPLWGRCPIRTCLFILWESGKFLYSPSVYFVFHGGIP